MRALGREGLRNATTLPELLDVANGLVALMLLLLRIELGVSHQDWRGTERFTSACTFPFKSAI
jgi:hypothetical protein